MSTTKYLFSGFGGQGILFIGKLVAYKGMIEDKQVSWLPSYGPEMRGGTASCSVIVSDNQVGSPIVSKPDVLIAMNLPSYLKYESEVKAGGIIVGCMPIVLGAVLYFFQPGLFRPFLSSVVGVAVVAGIVVLLVAGGLVIRKIMNIDI